MERDLHLLVVGASLREGSINLRLANLIGDRLRDRGAEVEVSDFAPFDAPSFDQDVLDAEGMAPGADALARALARADGFVLVSPEYNHSVPGFLKNTIDWLSRHGDAPLDGHHALLASASPSLVGGDRGLLALRVPLETLGTSVFPTHFALAQAHQAYADDGTLASAPISAILDRSLDRWLTTVAAVRGAEAAAARAAA